MTDTKPTTPLDLLDALEHNTGKDSRYTEEWQRAYTGLRAFLSSDLIQKLQDPKLRAAVEVLVAGLPEVMDLETTLETELWEVVQNGSDDGLNDAILGAWKYQCSDQPQDYEICRCDHADPDSEDRDLAFIVAARNLIHRASQAAQAATEKP